MLMEMPSCHMAPFTWFLCSCILHAKNCLIQTVWLFHIFVSIVGLCIHVYSLKLTWRYSVLVFKFVLWILPEKKTTTKSMICPCAQHINSPELHGIFGYAHRSGEGEHPE